MSLINLIHFEVKGDDRGSLVALEALKNIPFAIKRVYYLTKLSADYPRGFHAHIELKQVAICLNGSCRFVLDNGQHKEEVVLDSSAVGLYIPEMIWREMHDFSEDCVLIVLASEYYAEADYIRDYTAFLEAKTDMAKTIIHN